MNIGTRLTAIGDLVPKNMKLADIGTDHAYLPTKLVLDGKIDYAIAGDIVKGPCEAAGRTVALYGLNEKIEVRQGSGLAILTPNEVDVATIAGMGGSTIISILEADMPVATALKKLILQPMAGTPSLRKWLTNNGWIIEKEVLIEENDHIYVCMSAARGESKPLTELEAEIGTDLLNSDSKLHQQYIQRIRNSYRNLLEKMSVSENAKASDKYRDLQKLLTQVEDLYDARYGK